ncbi:uncharacterized protein [Physcomitrium patens]|uniref:Fungal lipase-type domain-containing protein n=1 Tax=Physcomitrium patens TaxID=3218 RepID=A0A2K1KQH6_PHYPA|nr:uncharacterized protein LOC112280770 [Physcomitrium patens]PNR56052.1 hypothetical protein PHYPA_006949 [Physcomitrium patens]|eukprot:XP_024372347.1 uncharacterized protein LOC112280770 [Physcomitrella patens]
MASLDANGSAPQLAAPINDRIENFNKLNWKGKLTVSTIVVCGLAAVSLAGVKLVRGLHGGMKKVVSNKGGGQGGDDSSLAFNVVAKGFSTVQSHIGPWSFEDLTLGLAAISKVTEKGPPHPPGRPCKEIAQNANFLARVQHWRSMAEAAYTCDPASFSLQSQLPESTIVAAEWNPCQNTLRPAYVVCIDGPYGAVVLSIRGTSQIVDMLVNSGTSAEPFRDGRAHGGFAKAAESLVQQVVPHIKRAFEEQSKSQKNLKLVITGHSMGAAVGVMAGMKLKESSEFSNLECWGFSTPACVTLELARGCKDFATSFIAHHDVVPRFSITSVERLRKRICDFDWDHAEKVAGGDDDWCNIKSVAEKLKSAQETSKKMSNSIKEAEEELGKQVKGVSEKIGVPLCENNSTDEDSEDKNRNKEEEKEEEKKEHPPLYPPGRLFVLTADPPGSGKMPEDRSGIPSSRSSGTYPTFEEAKKVTWTLNEADQEDLEEIVISPWCVSDHMLGNLGEGIGYLQRHCQPAFGGPPPL